MFKREVVSASCSVRLCVRRDSVVVVIVGETPVLVPRSSFFSLAWEVGPRERRVESVCVCAGGWGGNCDSGSGSLRGGTASGIEGGVGLVVEAWEGDEDGVSAPRRSSPSEKAGSSSGGSSRSSSGSWICTISPCFHFQNISQGDVHNHTPLTVPLTVVSIPAS